MANSGLTYLDACVMLSYIDGDEDRAPDIEELFRRAARGEIALITSVLSQVEVAFASAEKEGQALDPTIERAIDRLWEPASPIDVVEFFALIGQGARGLIRQAIERGWGLSAHDAIHLATAVHIGCDEFFTYDTKLPKFAQLTGLRIGPPENPQGMLGEV